MSESRLLSLAAPPPRFEGTQGDDFETWLERFEAWCNIHAPDEKDKLQYFPTLLGNAAFAIYRELDKKTKETKYGKVVEAFTQAYSSSALVEAFRSQLSLRCRHENENLAVYVGELKRLARRAYPKYIGCKEALDDVVLTHFLAGTGKIGEKVRHKYPKSVDEAVEFAARVECRWEAEKKLATAPVNVVQEQDVSPQPTEIGHRSEMEDMRHEIEELKNCVASLSVRGARGGRMRGNCFNCGLPGHFARDCYRARKPPPRGSGQRGQRGYRRGFTAGRGYQMPPPPLNE